MTRFLRAPGAAFILCALCAAPGSADITAQEVWDNWKGFLDIYGEDGVSIGSENLSGGTLTVSDLRLRSEDSEAVVEAIIEEIVLTENGDGTVSITMSEETPVIIEPADDDVTVRILTRQNGMTMSVGGTPEEMTYDLAAASYEFLLDELTGADAEVSFNAASMVMTDIAGSYTTVMGDLNEVDYDISIGGITVDLDAVEPGGPGTFRLTGTIDGMQNSGTGALPEEIDDPEMIFMEGLAFETSYVVGPVQMSVNFVDDAEAFQGQFATEGGTLDASMDSQGFSYSGGTMSPQISFSGSDVPFPVEVSMAEYGYTFTLPLAASDEPQDFRLQTNLTDVVINEMIWGLFDPTAVLPRDPATIAFDITGTGRLFFDVLDPEQAQDMAMADMPGELNSVTLEGLDVSAAGASVTGSGAFTFDNSDLVTFDGLPRPEGSLMLAVNGANGLIDKLIEMGLLPEDQAMGARMMMGMFAQPVGDDQLESVIEINAQGHVLANGQRLQ